MFGEVTKMPDKKTQADDPKAKATGKTQTAGAMPFSEMMEKMMAGCGCRPEQMSAMWAACCGIPAEQKEDQKTA